MYSNAWFRKLLTLHSTAIDFDILVLMLFLCGFQHNLLSIIIPRNLISTLSMKTLFDMSFSFEFIGQFLKIIHFVLLRFSVGLL